MSSVHSGPRKRPSKSLRPQKTEEPVDDSAWIHRDKLAAIEIQEMEEAGMHVRQPHRSDSTGPGGRTTRSSSRATSRAGIRRAQSKDLLNEEEQFINGDRKRVSTIHAADEEEHDYDTRQLPEQSSQEAAPEQYRQHTSRPSTSRIPISKISPVPVSSDVLERDSPLPRSRSGSNAFPSTWEDLQYAKRTRSGSVGSGILLDDVENTRPQSSHINEQLSQSPPKAKKSKPGVRSTSAQRPPSSSGKRPSTSHRPEGEAPWITSMYKPDPRLPPDQQMLPTHAKRMRQEQWEREGKLGSTYDRDFRLLDDEEIKQPPQSSSGEKPLSALPVMEKENIPPQPKPEYEQWPLAPADRRGDSGSPRPGTSGGYRITPHVSTPAHSPSPQPPAPVELPATERAPVRLPDYDEKEDRAAKKGCCCIVM